MARKRATLTDLLNDLTFKSLYNKYSMLAQSAFEWEGVPEEINPKYIERFLFDFGKAIFFKDPRMSFMCLQAQDSGKLNVYGEPLQYLATGLNYYRHYRADKCVIIENNPLRLNTKDFILFYVNKLTEAERTMDVNVKSCKTPVVFAVDDKDVLTFKRLFQQVDGNVPACFVDKSLNLDSIGVYDTKAKFLGKDLMDYKKSVENELLTFLGFDNLAVDKKERVNLSEANSNNQITQSFADLQLKSREKACELINEMYNLKISVKRKEIEPYVDNSLDGHNPSDSGTPRAD